jgi:hypothetical protein
MYRIPIKLIFFLFFIIATVAFAQSELRKKTLVINGRSGEATVFVVDGKPFISVETLVRIGEATVATEGNEVILTFPPALAQSQPHAPSPEMSADFMREAIQELAIIKDWYTTLARAIERGVPGDGSRLVIFNDRATEGLRLATVAASSSSDQSGLQLLTNHFKQAESWTRKLVKERKSMSTGNYSLTPNALDNDSDYQRLANCSKALGSMLSGGRYEDTADCH